MLTRNASGGGQSPGNNDAVVIAARRQGMEDERARQSDIRGRVRASNLPDSIAEDLISRGVSDNETIGATIIDAMAARGSQHPSRPSARVIEDNTDPAVLVERMATAIAARSTAHLPTTMRVAMPAEARQFGNLSLLDCWAELARARGEKIDRHMQRGPLFSALARSHSTSDFALLLAGSSNQVLLPAYNLAPPRFTIFAGRKSFADFKPHNFLRAGDFPAPLAKGETGEFSFGTLSESKNQAVCGTWGRVLRISRDIIINDNMSAFSQMPLAAARRAADFVNATGFALFALNAGGGPGITEAGATVNLWHATHANLAGAGGVIDLTNVGAGRTAMMKQTTLDGLKINVEPRFLLTSPDKLTIAEQFVATNLTPQVFSDVNPIGPKLVAIGDANLTGNAWYLFADPMLAETFVYGYLEGFEGPRFETRTDFMTEGVDMKLALDFGVSAIDFRGTYKNPGA